jgi:hypothetical protein
VSHQGVDVIEQLGVVIDADEWGVRADDGLPTTVC